MRLLVTRILPILLVFTLSLAAYAFYMLHAHWYEDTVTPAGEDLFIVPSGASLARVVNDMHKRALLADTRVAKLALRLFQPELTVKAGEYRLPQQATRAQLFELLSSGVSINYSVTLVEGITARDALLAVEAALPKDAALPAIDSPVVGAARGAATARPAQAPDKRLLALLAPEARQMMGDKDNPEGWFFPDTYRFVRGETADTVLRKAHHRMLQVLDEEWAARSRDLPFETRYEALIMASLVEKETGAIEERAQIAGVFTRRLRRGMRLQTDPTVIYGIRDTYAGNITRAHLRGDTPYNTYTRPGLPPTPIALPGRGAIRAALNPADGDTLYFVAKGDGSHYFSRNLEEHQRAVHKYQVLKRRSDYRSSPGP